MTNANADVNMVGSSGDGRVVRLDERVRAAAEERREAFRLVEREMGRQRELIEAAQARLADLEIHRHSLTGEMGSEVHGVAE